MNIFLIIILLLVSSCSFDDKSGIWTSEREIAKQNNQFKGFETLFSSKERFNQIIEIKKNFQFKIPPPINNIKWNDIYYNENNNFDNFEYLDQNNILIKSQKLSRHKSNEHIFQDGDKIIFSDQKGTIVIFSLNEDRIITKYNFYKNKFKNIKKKLNLIIENNIIYVSDNIGYLYAYDIYNEKILWAKNLKIPFRSNLKISKNILIASHQNNNLRFFNKLNGEILKLIPTEENVVKNRFINNLALNKENLFFLNTYGSLYSINMKNFDINWFLNLNESLDLNPSNLFFGSEIVINNNKLLVSSNQFFYILDLYNGSIIKKKNFTSIIKPIATDNYVFLITRKNLLVCIDLKKGDIIFSYDINEKIANFLDTKKKDVTVKKLFLVNNELFLFLNNSYVVKFEINGSIREISKLSTKEFSSLIFTNRTLILLSKSNRVIVYN